MKSKSLLFACSAIVALLATGRLTAQEPLKISMINGDGKEVGHATITDGPNGVIVGLRLNEKPPGISPGAHGFHLHAVGKCEPPFKSAGDHFAPQKHTHGFLSEKGSHAGDLPNIHVPHNGELMVEFFLTAVRLKQGKNRLLDQDGSALIIHANQDDYRSDPSGNAGDRIACGIIAPGAKTAMSK
jgi:Cu-Zn family superoxide dismutase